MSEVHEFKPDWTIAPAATLQECLDEMHLSAEVAAAACAPRGEQRDYCVTRIRAVLNREPMTEQDAQILAKATQAPARLWLALERGYRTGLAAGLIDATDT